MGNVRKKKAPPTREEIAKIVLSGSGPSADTSGLLRDIIAEFGGTKPLAREIYQQYTDAPAGSQTKQKYLEMIQRLIIMNTQHDLSKDVQPSEMTDEDLNLVAMRLIKKVYDAGLAGTSAEPQGS